MQRDFYSITKENTDYALIRVYGENVLLMKLDSRQLLTKESLVLKIDALAFYSLKIVTCNPAK
jgi:hypothetical protein